MGIFDRLSRLARSEFNHVLKRPRPSQDIIDDLPNDTSSPTFQKDSSQQWPREIAQDYATLEIPLGSSREEVRQAYRRLIQHYHPDVHRDGLEKNELATEISIGLGQAYHRLDEFLVAREKELEPTVED
jgi:DnaJ-domain-containing protein 1